MSFVVVYSYFTISIFFMLSPINAIDRNRFGVSYANTEDSNGIQKGFNELHFNDNNRHLFDGISGSPLSSFSAKVKSRLQRTDDSKRLRGTPQKPISLAIKTRRTFEVIPYNVDEEEIEPQIIEIRSKPIPLRLNFRTFSSPLNIHQTLQSDNADRPVEETSSEAEPHRMRHKVIKPVIQEVTEIIQPYRNHIQHIQPMIEDIRTIVPEQRKEANDGQAMAIQPLSTPITTSTDAEQNHNSVDNQFENAFHQNLNQNQRQDFDFRQFKNQMNFNHNSVNDQRIEQQLESGSALQESNWRRTYRLMPIVITNSEMSGNSWRRNQESVVRQRVMEIIKFLNF